MASRFAVTLAWMALVPTGAVSTTFFIHLTTDLPDCNLANTGCASNCAIPAGLFSCTLRAAVQEANDTPGPDEIVFSNLNSGGPETYSLTIAGSGEDAAATGDLDITEDVTLRASPGAAPILDGGAVDRVLHVLAGDATLRGLTLHGTAAKLLVASGAEAHLTRVVVNGGGGGLINNGTLVLDRCIIDGNTTALVGGGVWNSGTLAVTDSAITGNSAAGSGGGIDNFTDATAILVRSTLSGNSATGGTASGGGIWSGTGSTLTLTNCTISGNSAADFGGGIYFGGAALNLNSVTITDNHADSDAGGDGSGGGLFHGGAGAASAKNTLLAGNTAFTAAQSDCQGGLASGGHNLVGIDFCIFSPGAGDQLGSSGSPLDPLLGPLADHGGPGPMKTHEPLAGSPALEAGDPAGCADETATLLLVDQRGAPRAMPAGGECDVGAREAGQVFADVAPGDAFRLPIEDLYFNGVTAGCFAATPTYCADGPVRRGEAAVFLVASAEGSDFVPPACISGFEMFADVPFDDPLCSWIEELARRGVTSGCDADNYCPANPLRRDQLAALLLKALEGSLPFPYLPPDCVAGSEMFDDVPFDHPFCRWIEELARRGIAGGCGGGNYCPDDASSRQQTAAFLVATFGL